MTTFIRAGFFLAILCTFGVQTQADSVYKWADTDGTIHFGSAPPPESKGNAQRFDLDPRLMHSPSANPQAELQKRVELYNRYIELLRDMRAAELGISREELDALEAAGLLK